MGFTCVIFICVLHNLCRISQFTDFFENEVLVEGKRLNEIYNYPPNICLTSLTRAKCGVRSTLCWKIPNISGSIELFAL